MITQKPNQTNYISMHCFKENLDKWAVAWNTVTYCPKYTLYSSVKVFSTKVLFGDTIFTSPTGAKTAMVI